MRRVVAILVALAAAPATADDLLAEAARDEAAALGQVHTALAAALSGDRQATARGLDAIAALDVSRADAGLHPSGLSDDFRRLAAAVEPSRAARRAALEELLDDDVDAEVAHHAQHSLDSDDGARAERLLADDAHNRRANLVNDAIRPFGVFSGGALLAAVSPFLIAGSAVDSVATTAVNLWNWNDLSAPQREALVRYRAHLLREPAADDVPAAARALRALGQKRARALCEETTETGRQALDDGDLDRAAFWLRNAHTLDGCAAEARKPLEELLEKMAARGAEEEAGRWPVPEPVRPADPGAARAYEALTRAMAAGDGHEMMVAAQALLGEHPDDPVAPGAQLAIGVARDLGGHRDDAREALERAADDDSGPGRLASAMLDDPRFAPLDAMNAAERAHDGDVARYVLLGGVSGRSALYGAAQLGAQGSQAAQSLGIFNVIGLATRGWRAWRNDPASNDGIIERGEELLAREPDVADAPAVRERLAAAYERAGNYERALMHLRALPEPDGDRIGTLEGKLAEKLLEEAKGSPAERLLLTAIARHFPGTDAAEDATERLEMLPGGGEIPVDRETLVAHPGLLGPAALDLEPTLLDGDEANGELGPRGVTLTPRGLKLALATEEDPGEREEERPLAPDGLARARAAVEDALYARLVTKDDRDPEVGRYERWIPVYLRGAIGEEGVSVTPGIKLRRYRTEDPTLYE